MPERIKVFLDTSAVFAGMWSSTGGAHLILSLGEAGTLDIWVSPQVLSELETVLRMKAPGLLGEMALLLDRVQVHVGETAPAEQ
ncbi:MAG: hypothetical protein HUU38_13425, partial [Anaerolineales bacterium]|nr:hypothetical protein [Anaerolineales bacterium]